MEQHQGYIIVLAAGSGTRFGDAGGKQYIELDGKPIIVRTLEKYLQSFSPDRIRLIIKKEDLSRWLNIVERFGNLRDITTVFGGPERFHSVKEGLNAIHCSGQELVGVHDAVRPFVTSQTITNAFETARIHGTAVPIFDSVNTLRLVNGNKSSAIDRRTIKEVQNPQVFRMSILEEAYCQEYKTNFHDDATVVESRGFMIYTCNGNYENIKITYPQDILFARVLLKMLEKDTNEHGDLFDYRAVQFS